MSQSPVCQLQEVKIYFCPLSKMNSLKKGLGVQHVFGGSLYSLLGSLICAHHEMIGSGAQQISTRCSKREG